MSCFEGTRGEKDQIFRILAVYLQHFPDSAIAINLKACNHFKLYNGKAAEQELKTLQEQASSSFSFGQDLIQVQNIWFFSPLVRSKQEKNILVWLS